MKKIIINKTPWQTRIALLHNGDLQNIYLSSPRIVSLERTFFKGIITKVLPGIQTAFVDIGQSKAGFLHISEVDRELAVQKMSESIQLDEEEATKPVKPVRRQPLDMKNIFKEGEHVLVQVSKEPIYEKGPKLTTCFTLPGRFIVLMPNIPRIGVSKKIENREERARLREIVKTNLPKGMGAIIRTTSEESSEKLLVKDIAFLVRTWHTIQKNFASAEPKAKIHEDLELTLQIVRDQLDDDVEAIVTDDKENQRTIHRFIKNIAPEYSHIISHYHGKANVFEHFGVEKQIEQTLKKNVQLKSGGSLIIESTEAMTVIDVNTGRFTGKSNLEETILKTNLEAAEETVRQLRLRNIGGLIVIDFIDMASPSNRNKLFNFFDKTLRARDKFQSVVLKVSEFGLVQMTRKRSGKTLQQEFTTDCPTCAGLGFVKSLQTQCYSILRSLDKDLHKQKLDKAIELHISPAMFEYITSKEYDAILALEKNIGTKIELISQKSIDTDQYKIEKK